MFPRDSVSSSHPGSSAVLLMTSLSLRQRQIQWLRAGWSLYVREISVVHGTTTWLNFWYSLDEASGLRDRTEIYNIPSKPI